MASIALSPALARISAMPPSGPCCSANSTSRSIISDFETTSSEKRESSLMCTGASLLI
jgi:hypothetical protein